ncbi:gamma-secretase aspartyl protease complex, presenilin enhancer-2 subunit, partial [Piptocephalis cylindrospora]
LAFPVFLGGFAFLPFLWAVNFFYMFKVMRERSDRIPRLKQYVWGSGIGALLWFIALTTWYAVFVNTRTTWGPGTDHFTVVLITGE